MADLRIKFLATSIEMQMHLRVFLPEASLPGNGRPAVKLKTLWLLHGEGGDCSDWQRLSMVEHHAEQAGIALVMPSVDNSMYMDMIHGGYPYFRYLSEELPRHVRDLVKVLSDQPEDNRVAGVGIGGYGALKWALRSPGMFSAAACLSAPIDIVSTLARLELEDRLTDEWAAAFGDARRIASTQDDILTLADRVEGRSPAIHLAASAADEHYTESLSAARRLRASGLGISIHEDPKATGWSFWDSRIQAFIADMATGAPTGLN